MTPVALATCSVLPDLDDDERLVIPALAVRGVEAVAQVWDNPGVDWGEFELVVIRSTWDYVERRDEYLAWCASIRRLCNGLPVITWNTDKVYLRDLAGAGIPMVPTVYVAPGDAVLDVELPRGELVVKPAISGGAQNTARYRANEQEGAREHVERLLAAGRTVMVQPYVASVDEVGETGLVYFDGELSHAFRKGPVLRDSGTTTSDLWAPEEITATEPSADERGLASTTLDALPWDRRDLLYARVDLVRSADGGCLLLELELTEPSLYLVHGRDAAARFAAAIGRRVGR